MPARSVGALLALAISSALSSARAADAPSAAPLVSSSKASAVTVVDDPAAAKLLFDEAVKLASQGNFVEACQKLEASRRLHDGIGTSFHLAGCWQKVGRSASAHALFGEVAQRAEDAGQTERAELARSRMEALAPRLSRIRIEVAERAVETEVYRDDTRVPESDWGKAVAVDRGVHTLRVTAKGKKAWSSEVDVNAPSIVIAVMVPALVDDSTVPALVPPVKVLTVKATPSPRAEAKPEQPSSGAKTRAVILGGVGVAALAFGAFEGAKYLSSNRDATAICPSSVDCSQEEIAAHEQAVSDAKQARTWAIVGLSAGGATVALATYLFLSAPGKSAPSDEKRSARLVVEPLLDPRGNWGAALSGSF
jgi:hypothetical protein